MPASIDTIGEGESFFVNAFVEDLRFVASGVFAAYLDVLYNTVNVSLAGALTYGSEFPNGHRGDTSTAGLIDEAGAFGDSSTPFGPLLLLSIPFTADAPGQATFTADPADNLPATDTLLLGGAASGIPIPQIRYVDDVLTIVASGNGEAEGEAGAFASAADQLFAGDNDWVN